MININILSHPIIITSFFMVNIKCNFETALLCTGHAPRLAGFSFSEPAPLVVKAEL